MKEMEIIKSLPREIEFVNLKAKLSSFTERNQYVPAVFNERDLLSTRTLYNVFDGECVTHEIEGDENAMGFIGGVPTHAVAEYNKVILTAKRVHHKACDWLDAIFQNCFGFDERQELDTTIYDRQDDILIWCYGIGDNTVVLEFFHNTKYEK